MFEEAKSIQTCIDQILEKPFASRKESFGHKRVIGATCAATGFECLKDM